MIKSFREIRQIWVFSSETSPALPLGKVVDLVIDPNAGQCVALWVNTLDGLRLVDFRDIKKWKAREIFVSSQKDILKPEEFPRISAILDREVRIIDADVFVNEGRISRKIGQVKNFLLETNFPVILSILVNKGWWIFGEKVEIPRNRILKIDEEGVFVSDNIIKVEGKEEELDSTVVPSLD